MNVGIDNSPLVSSHKLAHKIRGTGFYTKNLIDALIKYHPEHNYILFTQGSKITEKIDVYHYPYFEPFFISLPYIKPGKTIVTVHDLTPLVFPGLFPVGLRGKLKYRMQRFLAKKSDAIITDSESSKTDIEHFFKMSSSQVFSVPLAAAAHFEKQSISKTARDLILKKYDLPEKFVLYVGDATPNKNLKRLVMALKSINVPLVMVGGALAKKDIEVSHPWNTELRFVQEEAQGNKNIQLLGFVDDNDLVSLYNLATLFVFPSLYEGFGLPVLEAAACGCPVVTSSKGSLEEVMGNAALYVDPTSQDEIADMVQKLYNDRKLQEEYAKKGILRAKEFSWEKTADNTVKVYEKIYSKK